jgi:hypothetical protein
VPNIFASNESLNSIAPIVAMEILRVVKKSPNKRLSLFEIFDRIKGRAALSPKKVYHALVFMFALGLIEFDGVYVSVGEDATG